MNALELHRVAREILQVWQSLATLAALVAALIGGPALVLRLFAALAALGRR